MSMRVNTNIMAINAQRNLGISRLSLSKTFEKLSSGLRINRAADDAAGLAISEKMRSQIRGMGQAINNAQDGINLIQTAEGALNEIQNILHRMRELTIQASNDTLVNSDREKIQKEIDELRQELSRLAGTSEFNTRKLLDGSVADPSIGKEATFSIKQNIRVGDTGATILNISDLLSNAVIISAPGSTRSAATVDVAFQFKIVAWQDNNNLNAPVSTGVEIRSSVDGFLTLIRLGLGGVPANSSITLTIGSSIGTATDIAAISINFGNISLCDVGKTSLAQVIARQEVVTLDNSLVFQIGPNEGQFIKLGIDDITAKALRLESATVLGTNDEDSRLNAQNTLGVIDDALERVSALRARLGAIQNRLESATRSLNIAKENLSNSESTIRDADFAKETAALTRAQILVQAGTAILAQANADPQQAIQLLR